MIWKKKKTLSQNTADNTPLPYYEYWVCKKVIKQKGNEIMKTGFHSTSSYFYWRLDEWQTFFLGLDEVESSGVNTGNKIREIKNCQLLFWTQNTWIFFNLYITYANKLNDKFRTLGRIYKSFSKSNLTMSDLTQVF